LSRDRDLEGEKRGKEGEKRGKEGRRPTFEEIVSVKITRQSRLASDDAGIARRVCQIFKLFQTYS
jgi:hypothetical protein